MCNKDRVLMSNNVAGFCRSLQYLKNDSPLDHDCYLLLNTVFYLKKTINIRLLVVKF